ARALATWGTPPLVSRTAEDTAGEGLSTYLRAPAVSAAAAGSCWSPARWNGPTERQSKWQTSNLELGSGRSFCGPAANDGEVFMTQERLDQLLEAEITTIALQRARPLTLQSIMHSTRNAGNNTENCECQVRQMYVTSFKDSICQECKDFGTVGGFKQYAKSKERASSLIPWEHEQQINECRARRYKLRAIF
ncbi:unnamed protein product, partial [Polarella glacialis]